MGPPQRLDQVTDAGRRHPEHGQSQRGFRIPLQNPFSTLHHARQRMRGIAQHPTRDPVQPLHICHRVHDGDIARTHVRRHVPAGHRRDQHLRHPHRQGLHRRCNQRRATRAARSDHTPDPVRAANIGFERHRHRTDRRAAIRLPQNRLSPVRMTGRHLRRRHVRRPGYRGPQVNRPHGHSRRFQAVRDVGELRALGVERPCDRRDHARQAAIAASVCARSTMPASDPSPLATSEAAAVPRCAQSSSERPSASPAMNPAV